MKNKQSNIRGKFVRAVRTTSRKPWDREKG